MPADLPPLPPLPPIRVGQGFDAHPFSDDPARPLVPAEVVLGAR